MKKKIQPHKNIVKLQNNKFQMKKIIKMFFCKINLILVKKIKKNF